MNKPHTEPAPPVIDPAELQAAIVALARGMKALSASRLKRDTIILLLHDATGLGKRDIAKVLMSLDNLEHLYLKPAKVKP